MSFDEEKRMLPEFPRTPHLPYRPNATTQDVIALEADAKVVFDNPIFIEEKLDGASVGITIKDDEPVIRNRDHILRKGYVKNTPAKKQFAPVWNWFYDKKDQISDLLSNGTWSLYGEWMMGRHGMSYETLPEWFILYDIYDYHHGWFLAPRTVHGLARRYGFTTPPVLFQGKVESPDDLCPFTQKEALWASERVEGAYIRVGDELVSHRFKMVREDFQRGLPQFGEDGKLIKNQVKKCQSI